MLISLPLIIGDVMSFERRGKDQKPGRRNVFTDPILRPPAEMSQSERALALGKAATDIKFFFQDSGEYVPAEAIDEACRLSMTAIFTMLEMLPTSMDDNQFDYLNKAYDEAIESRRGLSAEHGVKLEERYGHTDALQAVDLAENAGLSSDQAELLRDLMMLMMERELTASTSDTLH